MILSTANNLLGSYWPDLDVNLVSKKIPTSGKNRTLSTSDDRGYLETSALMAGALAKDIFQKFDDPAIFLVAHHSGQGGASQALKCNNKQTCKEGLSNNYNFRKRHNSRRTNLDDLYRYQMTKKEYIDYAFKILAIKFIGADPKSYGFCVPSPDAAAKLSPDTLTRPTGSVL